MAPAPAEGIDWELGTAVWLLGCSLVAAALQLTPALAQEGPNAAAASGQDASDPDQDPGPEGDVLNVQRLLQLLYQVKTSPGTDLNGNPVTTTTDAWKLRWDSTYMLSSQWWLVLRGDLPYLAKDKYSDSNPNGDFLYGLGDADIQAALIDNINAAGKQAPAPGSSPRPATPRSDRANGRSCPSPAYATRCRKSAPAAMSSRSCATTSASLAIPPGNSSATCRSRRCSTSRCPEIRWNFVAPITGQTGRLFLPFDARMGHKFSDNFNVSLKVAVPIVKQYPVYDFMTALRFNLTF